VAGGEGFEPSTPNLGEGTYGSLDLPLRFNAQNYRIFLVNKYCQQYARTLYNHTIQHMDCLTNPSLMLSLKPHVQLGVMKAMACLSKYLGCYESYKLRLKNYGIKWANNDTSFAGFLAMFGKRHDTLPLWIREVFPLLHANERLFVRFLAVTGLRKNEGLTAFNLIITLYKSGRLGEYYNVEDSVLEHFLFGKRFLRGTKNAFVSIVPNDLITQICSCTTISYNAIHCRFNRKRIPVRLKELRSYQNTYLRKHGVLSELVDVLAGRVPKSVFCRHYLAVDMKEFSNQVLAALDGLEASLFANLLREHT